MRDSRLLARLSSPRLAAWLISILILMSLVAVLIPQSRYLGAAFEQFEADNPALSTAIVTLGLDRLFEGWIMIIVVALLVVNVSACSLRRILRRSTAPRPAVLRDARIVSLPPDRDLENALDDAQGLLRSSRWSVGPRDEGGFAVVKGTSGFWGSMLLHASLLILVVGGAATAVTSFRGELAIADGQTVVDEPAAYISVKDEPSFGTAYKGTRISQDSTEVRYDDGTIISAVARVRAVDAAGRIVTHGVRVNHPLDVDGKSYLLLNSGYSVSLLLAVPGATPQPITVNLAERVDSGWRDTLAFTMPDGTPLTLDMTATPVPVAPGEPEIVELYDLKDPRLAVTATLDGRPTYTGVLVAGDTATPFEGASLTFERLGLWNRYLVRGEPARWVTYLGFWVAVAGAAWRFAVPERRISVVVKGEPGEVRVSYRARPWAGFEGDRDRTLLEQVVARLEGHPESRGSESGGTTE